MQNHRVSGAAPEIIAAAPLLFPFAEFIKLREPVSGELPPIIILRCIKNLSCIQQNSRLGKNYVS